VEVVEAPGAAERVTQDQQAPPLAAALTPQAMVIIQAVFPRERMGTAFGVFSSMVGLAAASPPHGVPPQLVPELRQLIRDVFTHGYIAAIRPTLAISVAVLLAGAAGCLLLRRHTASPAAVTSAPPAAVTSAPAEAASPPTVTSPAAAGAGSAAAAGVAGQTAASGPHPEKVRIGGAASS
jgi:hypothetical protein